MEDSDFEEVMAYKCKKCGAVVQDKISHYCISITPDVTGTITITYPWTYVSTQ